MVTSWSADHFEAGRLCLDFANTVGGARGVSPREKLGGFEDLVEWSRLAKVVGDAEARRLSRRAGDRPADAARVLKRAKALREAIYGAFARVLEGARPRRRDLAAINRELGRSLARTRLAQGADGLCLCWEWDRSGTPLDLLLWPIGRSAAELLTSEDAQRVRECDSDACTWLFLDTTKNRCRRWCDMKTCGNRAKVRRFRARRCAQTTRKGSASDAETSTSTRPSSASRSRSAKRGR